MEADRQDRPRRSRSRTGVVAAVEPAIAAVDSEKEISEEDYFREGRSWYVIHTYSGYENKVKTNLEHRIESMDAGDLIYRVFVPTVDEIEVHAGVRRTVSRKIFPGYVLVEMTTLVENDVE